MSLLKIKKINSEAIIPSFAHEGDAGMDINSVEDVSIEPGEVKLVSTGIALEIPAGFEIQVRPRSGLAIKHGITLLNTPGTIDSGYRGEVKVIMINHGKVTFKVEKGMRIAQLVMAKFYSPAIKEVEELSDTRRGEGGFGSTGAK